MADFPPPYAPPSDPGPTSTSYTPSQYEAIKSRFRDLFRIVPKLLRPFFLLLHDDQGNSYPSTDRHGRVIFRNVEREVYLNDLRRKCTNDASNAGAQSMKLEPAANSILFIYFISSKNLDAAGVNHDAKVFTAAGAECGEFYNASVAASGMIVFPRSETGVDSFCAMNHPSFFITDVFEIKIQTGSVAVSQDSDFFILYSYIGDAPTITEVGPTGSAFTDVG